MLHGQGGAIRVLFVIEAIQEGRQIRIDGVIERQRSQQVARFDRVIESVSLMGEVNQPTCGFPALTDELDFGMVACGIVQMNQPFGKLGVLSQLIVLERRFEFGLVVTDQCSFIGRGGIGRGFGNFGLGRRLGGLAQSPEFGEEFLHGGGDVNTVAG